MKKLISLLLLISSVSFGQTLLNFKGIQRTNNPGELIMGVPTGTLGNVLTPTATINFSMTANRPTTLSGYGITNGVLNTSSITINGVTKTFTSTPTFTTTLSDVLAQDASTGGTPITSPNSVNFLAVENSGVTMSSAGGEVGTYSAHAYMTADGQSNTNIETSLTRNTFNHNLLNSFTAPANNFTGSVKKNGAELITGADLAATSPLFYNSSTGTFTIQPASTSQAGALSSIDWNNFNSKINSVNGTTNRITSSGGVNPTIDISSTFEALLSKIANRIDQNNASTTSAQLATTISDETGTGNLVYNAGPSISSPTITGSTTITGTVTAPTPTINSNNTQVANAAYVDIKTPFVTPEMYGAVGDGSTNDAAAIQSAVNSGHPVLFGNKNYRITSTISLPGNVMLMGFGKNSIISTTSNILMFNCQSSYNTIKGISFVGNSAGGSQTAIFADGVVGLTNAYVGNIVTGCYFINLGNSGIGTRYNIGTSFPTYSEGCFTISDCIFDGCTTGINFLVRGEYNSVSNCKIYRCTTGIAMTGGNNSMTGGQITQCTTGVSLIGGTNDGHASFNGVKINHNTTNVNASSLTLGYVFSACMFYGGDITLVSSPRIRFIGCNFSTLPTITCTNSSEVFFINCEFVTNPTLTITGTRPTFERCRYVAGCPANQLRDGESTLASGTITVANISTTANTRIYLTRRTIGAAPGNLTYTITAGTSFTINSDNASDNGIIEWQLLEKTN